jgi:hypothetical protein
MRFVIVSAWAELRTAIDDDGRDYPKVEWRAQRRFVFAPLLAVQNKLFTKVYAALTANGTITPKYKPPDRSGQTCQHSLTSRVARCGLCRRQAGAAA